MVEFARIWPDMPKIVFSRTLERADCNTTIVRDVVADEIMELKAQPGGDLALGGADLAAAFMRHDLIDEYRLCCGACRRAVASTRSSTIRCERASSSGHVELRSSVASTASRILPWSTASPLPALRSSSGELFECWTMPAVWAEQTSRVRRPGDLQQLPQPGLAARYGARRRHISDARLILDIGSG
jgi:hypothetical protein